MSCKHVSLELRPKTSETISNAYTNEGRQFQMVGAQHENRRAAMFVDEDCVDSRSDVDDLRTRDCLYDESKIRRLLQFDVFVTEDGNLVVDSVKHKVTNGYP